SRAAPDIKRTPRRFGLQGKKILQVGKGQVGAQPALGCFEVDGILVRATLKAFTVGVSRHLHAASGHQIETWERRSAAGVHASRDSFYLTARDRKQERPG